MTEHNPPEELVHDDGKWARKDVFIDEFATENDVDTAKAEEVMNELIEDGPLEEQEFHGAQYVRGISRTALLKSKWKNQTKNAVNVSKQRVNNAIFGTE